MTKQLQEIVEEFKEVDMGDKRLEHRLQQIVSAWSQNPAAGLPLALGSEAALKGAYRFLNHRGVKAKDILEVHAKRSWGRICNAQGNMIVAHDTTSFSFGGQSKREGLGPLRNKKGEQGFFGHLSCVFSEREK